MAADMARRIDLHHPMAITAVIYLAGLGAAGQFSKLAVTFVTLTETYNAAATTLGLAVSLISLVGVVLGLVAGMVVNRIGSQRALVGALILGAVLSALQATLPDLSLLMASRILEGLSHLLIVVAAPTLIAERVPDRHKPLALSLWSTFFGVAFAGTALLAPPILAASGLPGILMVHAGWMACAAALCAFLIPPPITPLAPIVQSGTFLQRQARAYATPGIMAPASAWLCYTLTFVSVLTALPLLTDGGAPGWLASAAPLVSIVLAMTVGVFLLGHYPALNVLVAGFVVCVCVTALTALLGFGALTVLLLFGAMSLVQGSGFAVVPQLNADAETRALANGALAQMGNLGNLTGTPILIALHQSAPLAGPVAFLATAYVCGALLTLWLGRRALAVRA